MPWTSSTRSQRLPKDWRSICRRILNRDAHRCQTIRVDTGQPCHQPARQVDHITPGDNHHPSNLQAICDWHHAKKSSAEGNQARHGKPRSAPVHPGLL
jgi:hypothetical protein